MSQNSQVLQSSQQQSSQQQSQFVDAGEQSPFVRRRTTAPVTPLNTHQASRNNPPGAAGTGRRAIATPLARQQQESFNDMISSTNMGNAINMGTFAGHDIDDYEDEEVDEVGDEAVMVEGGVPEAHGDTPTETDEEIERNIRLMMPADLSSREAQAFLDVALYNHRRGAIDTSISKRTYDGKRFSDLYPDGKKVWARMITACRITFARYLTVPTANIPEIIDIAAKRTVDRDDQAFKNSYERCMEWRKNWSSRFITAVFDHQGKLETDNFGYANLTENQLRMAYTKHFTYEALYVLMGTASGVIDWRATLAVPNLKGFYRSIFVYAMIYAHKCRHFPATLTRKEASTRLKAIVMSPQFATIRTESLILLARKPASKVRVNKRREIESIAVLDPDFVPLLDEDEDEDFDPLVDDGMTRPDEESFHNSESPARSDIMAASSIPETALV
ncbi:hypothetical protein DFP73DRAFT_598579 [Morchella snyderi]|nr:hypothetical protein DFP73DRAFT_598579 [Morchella snyderi]